MEMCRACLSTGVNMNSMDETAVENFNQITQLNIKLSEHKPVYTCDECSNALNFCKKFIDKCITSDHTWKDIQHLDNKICPESNCKDKDDYYLIVKSENDNKSDDDIEDTELDDEIFEPIFVNIESREHKRKIKNTVTENSVTEESIDEEISNQQDNCEFLCGLCPEKFINRNMLIEHLPVHANDINCLICLEQCNSKCELLAHRMQHVHDGQKCCLFCNRSFLSSTSLHFHFMTVHKLEDEIFNEIKHAIGAPPIKKNKLTSKDVKRIKKNSGSNKVKQIVIPDKIILTETELKKLIEKPKEGFVPYYCGVCYLEFEDKKQLLSHLEFHKTDTHCSICGMEFKSYPHILAHRFAHVPKNQSSCLYCSRKIMTEQKLEHHYWDMHKVVKKTEKQLIIHIKNIHGDIMYVCDYCKKSFRYRSALKSHITSHIQDKKDYKCEFCPFRAKLAGTIKGHVLRRHTARRVYCCACRRAFPSPAALDRHKPCAHSQRVSCPVCGLLLTSTSTLARHLHTHTDVYRYKCELCPSQYKSKSSYDAHMNRHNGTRKHACDYCPMKFYSQPVLIKHRRVHTGERPYACKLCKKAFTGNHNLKVHMRVHGIELIKKKKQ